MLFKDHIAICDRCDHRAELKSGHSSFYRMGEELFPVVWQDGWCHTCQTIRQVERLPDQNNINEIDALLGSVERIEESMRTADPSDLLGLNNANVLIKCRTPAEEQQWTRHLEDLRRKRRWLAQLVVPGRSSFCKACGGRDVIAIAESRDYREVVLLQGWMGFRHPGCGGHFVKVLRQSVHVKLRGVNQSIYGIDGGFLGEEFKEFVVPVPPVVPVQGAKREPIKPRLYKRLRCWLTGGNIHE